MLVKIGDKLFDSTKEPIMIIVSKDEKSHICNMPNKKYCSFPDGSDLNMIKQFMKVSDDALSLVDYDEHVDYGHINEAIK